MLRYLRYGVELLGVLFLCGLVCLLPRSWAHRVGRWLGGVAYHLSARSRKVAIENLQARLGLDLHDAKRLANASHRTAGAALIDMLRAPRMSKRVARRDVEVPEATWRALNDIREGGKGAVLAASHYGNWELNNLVFPYAGVGPGIVVVRPQPNQWLNKFVRKLRGWSGQEVVYRHGAVMACALRVRRGGIAIVTSDVAVPPDSGAAVVDFLGLPTYATLGIGFVAATTGAPVYAMHVERIGGSRYRFVLKGPIEVEPGPDRRATALAITRAVNVALEETIRREPSGWAWWLKRWRIIPVDATARYPSYAVSETRLWPAGTKPTRDARA